MKILRVQRWLIAFVLGVAAQIVCAQPITITPIPPRAFGYSIGDRIERRIDIQVAPPWSLAHASLPTPGRVSAWFELAEISIQTDVAASGTRSELHLVYQLLNSPTQPTFSSHKTR